MCLVCNFYPLCVYPVIDLALVIKCSLYFTYDVFLSIQPLIISFIYVVFYSPSLFLPPSPSLFIFLSLHLSSYLSVSFLSSLSLSLCSYLSIFLSPSLSLSPLLSVSLYLYLPLLISNSPPL